MTIDSGWVGMFKREVPAAFQPKYPFKRPPEVACIDGMPLLMISEHRWGGSGSGANSWDSFVRNNFARHAIYFFRTGCKRVIFMFDNYDEVPMAKSITQANRSKKHAPYQCGEGSQLPTSIPQGYNEKLCNRIFKRKVIDMVCNRLVEHVTISTTDAYTRTLVIDYVGCPIQFQGAPMQARLDPKPTFMVDIPPMGEADVKFLRWGEHFGGEMIVYSVDGDFIPISLMKQEEVERKRHVALGTGGGGGQGTTAADVDGPKQFQVCLYRMKYNEPGTVRSPVTATGKGGGAKKMEAGASAAPSNLEGGAGTDPVAASEKKKSRPREFEYVDIPTLYSGLRALFSSICPLFKRSSKYDHHYMRILAVLIGLSGTDFSRGLPLIGPGTMWDMVNDKAVFAPLLQCYSIRKGLVRPKAARGSLVCNIYMKKFSSHFKNAPMVSAASCGEEASASHSIVSMLSRNAGSKQGPAGSASVRKGSGEHMHCSDQIHDSDDDSAGFCGFSAALDVLQGSSLSERTKESLPSCNRVDSTFQNINWILKYWECKTPLRSVQPGTANDSDARDDGYTVKHGWDYSGCYPDPFDGNHGFRRVVKKNAQGKSTCVVKWADEVEEEGDCLVEEEDDIQEYGAVHCSKSADGEGCVVDRRVGDSRPSDAGHNNAAKRRKKKTCSDK